MFFVLMNLIGALVLFSIGVYEGCVNGDTVRCLLWVILSHQSLKVIEFEIVMSKLREIRACQ